MKAPTTAQVTRRKKRLELGNALIILRVHLVRICIEPQNEQMVGVTSCSDSVQRLYKRNGR